MMRALYTAASGMRAQQTNVDNISNNIANVNTTAFKSQKTEFKSLLYQTIQTRTTSANGEEKPIGAQVGLGTRVASNTTSYTQGALLEDESKSAFAIEGNGFFQVRGADGTTYYTRNGNFNWSIGPTGTTLTNTDGYPVLDSNGNTIVLPNNVNSGKAVVTTDGQVGYYNNAGAYVSMNRTIGLSQFSNPAGLEKAGSNLLRATNASGAALNEATNANLTRSKIHQSYLEGSNVQVADEMVNLIVAQRAYQLNSKAITTSDDMLMPGCGQDTAASAGPVPEGRGRSPCPDGPAKTDAPSKGHPEWQAFLSCWELWPVKQGQEEAWREWMRLHGNGTLAPSYAIREAIARLLAEDSRWARGMVPRMARWLHGKGWHDEPFVQPGQGSGGVIVGVGREPRAPTEFQQRQQDSRKLARALLEAREAERTQTGGHHGHADRQALADHAPCRM